MFTKCDSRTCCNFIETEFPTGGKFGIQCSQCWASGDEENDTSHL